MKTKSTTDIWFAAYLKMHGFVISDFDVLQGNRGRFYFVITDEEWKEFKVKFDTSETSKIKLMQIALKDLLY